MSPEKTKSLDLECKIGLPDNHQVHIRYPRTPEDSEKVASLKLVHIEHFFEPEEDEEIPTVEVITLANGSEVFVGRDKPAARGRSAIHVQLGDFRVSKEHFRIYMVMYEPDDTVTYPQMFYIEDLGSANGTYVNNHLVGSANQPGVPYLLNDGDRIEIGDCWRFEFEQKAREGPLAEFPHEFQREHAYIRNWFDISKRCLGSGLYSKVYKASYKSSGNQLAVKIVDLDEIEDEKNKRMIKLHKADKERLLNEVKILASLNHPNIISIKQAFVSSHRMYIFEELAPGGDLTSFVNAKGGVLTNAEAMVVMRQIALAVNHIHSKAIVHRDIKPENVLVMHSEIGHRIVLADFGCAALVYQSSRMVSCVGTQEYVAPEIQTLVCERAVPYTKAVDIWSMGVVAYSLLVGQLPGFKPDQTLSQGQVNERLQHSSLVKSAKGFVMRCLTIDASSRMTASGALSHAWFTEPRAVRLELNDLYKRATKLWKPRQTNVKPIREIPAEGSENLEGAYSEMEKKKEARKRDSSSSRYFGLSKHLTVAPEEERLEINRQRAELVDELNRSGKTFLSGNVLSTYTPRKAGQLGALPRTPVKAIPLEHERMKLARVSPTSPTKAPTATQIMKVMASDMFASLPHESQILTQTQTQMPVSMSLPKLTINDAQASFLLLDDDDEVSSSPSQGRGRSRGITSSQPNAADAESMVERPQTHTGETPSFGLGTGLGIFDSQGAPISKLPEHPASAKKRKHAEDDEDDETEEQPAKKRSLQRIETLSQEEVEARRAVLNRLPVMASATQYAQSLQQMGAAGPFASTDPRPQADGGGSRPRLPKKKPHAARVL